MDFKSTDKIVYLGNSYINKTKKQYRIVKIIDSKGKELNFVTNVLHFTSEEIAWLYKKQRGIELFFNKRLIKHSLTKLIDPIKFKWKVWLSS